MSECLNTKKENLTKCAKVSHHSGLPENTLICSDNSNCQETEPGVSEHKNRPASNNNEILIQYIHFNLNKNGCLE
jgi:hypothetical protein